MGCKQQKYGDLMRMQYGYHGKPMEYRLKKTSGVISHVAAKSTFMEVSGWENNPFSEGEFSSKPYWIARVYFMSFYDMAVCQNLVPLVNIKIAGKWMFIPLKMVLIGIDP
jgi:hypothetical protein